jgi:hypothetical protein
MSAAIAQDQDIGQDIDQIKKLKLAIDPDGHAFTGEPIDDAEHSILPAIMVRSPTKSCDQTVAIFLHS